MAETGPVELRRSPLAHLEDRMRGARGGALRELPFLTMVSVRVAPGSAAFDRIGAALGAGLPERVADTARAGAHTALWLGPDEWLVVSSADPGPLVADLVEALAGDSGTVVDVSANRTILELSGAAARQVLEKGCPADLHPRSFGPGDAVTTTLGPVPVLLWQSGPSTYLILPRASFADYVARWLLDAMTEFASRAG
ncbi:sarcosine oxidase subunit gamma family protein [Streptosporangium sp. NPDC005286]|uniref:sarcosine oxidase subunit gamma n=1 Tax=Streptosporangium sp. NPDC005286 TaxID=3154463 RepID=UPI0033A9B057